jgi:hypothetical protein
MAVFSCVHHSCLTSSPHPTSSGSADPFPAPLAAATELLELLRTVGLRYNIQGLVQAVLEGHRGVRAKRRLLQQQLEVGGDACTLGPLQAGRPRICHRLACLLKSGMQPPWWAHSIRCPV